MLYVFMIQRHVSARGRDVPIPMIVLIRPTQPNELLCCPFLEFLFGAMHLKGLENKHFLAGPPPKASLRTAAVRLVNNATLINFFESFLFLIFILYDQIYSCARFSFKSLRIYSG